MSDVVVSYTWTVSQLHDRSAVVHYIPDPSFVALGCREYDSHLHVDLRRAQDSIHGREIFAVAIASQEPIAEWQRDMGAAPGGVTATIIDEMRTTYGVT